MLKLMLSLALQMMKTSEETEAPLHHLFRLLFQKKCQENLIAVQYSNKEVGIHYHRENHLVYILQVAIHERKIDD